MSDLTVSYNAAMASSADITPAAIHAAMERMLEIGPPLKPLPDKYLVFVNGKMSVFSAPEMMGVANGYWMPDFLDDFRRWFAATAVLHGIEERILGVKLPPAGEAFLSWAPVSKRRFD